MTKRLRTLLVSMTAIALSTAAIAGGTYALFTDSAKVTNHLQAGTLKVGLVMTEYTDYLYDSAQDKMGKVTNTDDVDLVTSDKAVFSIEDFAPTYYREATIEITNNGTVAFDYSLSIVYNGETSAEAIAAQSDETTSEDTLAAQIQITVTYGTSSSTTFLLSEANTKGSGISLGYLESAEDSATFKVKAEFLNLDNAENNKAQGRKVEFDIQVTATQRLGTES